jgi:hypothetical protein
MSIVTMLMVAALVGVIGSFAMGVAAMASDGVVGHHSSAQWMTMRVAFEGLALALVVLSLLH